MPVAIPLAMIAAGAISAKIAANQSAKNQANAQQALNNKTSADASQSKGYIDPSRSAYSGMMNDVQSGKYDFTPKLQAPEMNASNDFYENAMGTGLYTQSDINDWRDRQALNNTAQFDAVKRGLNENADIRGGGYSGYNNQLAKVARDAARSQEAGRLGAESQLQQNIRSNKFEGAQGVQSNSTNYINQERNNADISNAAQQSNVNNRYTRTQGLQGAMDSTTSNYLGLGSSLDKGAQAVPQPMPWWGTLGAGLQQAGGSYLGAGGGKTPYDPVNDPNSGYYNNPTPNYGSPYTTTPDYTSFGA